MVAEEAEIIQQAPVAQPVNQEYLGEFAGSGAGEQEFITIENEKLKNQIPWHRASEPSKYNKKRK